MPDNVNYMKPELAEILETYTMIEDCISNNLKKKGTLYLPKPDPSNNSETNNERYKVYLQRAVVYNATSRTLNGFNGQVFMRKPHINVPEKLKYVEKRVDGCSGINQFAQKLNFQVLALGRSGVLVDYPVVKKPITESERQRLGINPAIIRYHPAMIRNWQEKLRGAEKILSLVVLDESYVKKAGRFEPEYDDQRRVLFLDENDVVQVEVWQRGISNKNSKEFALAESYTPRNAKGETMNTIPFEFVGACDNDSEIDDPPMESIAVLQVGHYINSADYEDSCHMVGQPTLVLNGLTKKWLDDVLKGHVYIGSRSSISLPEKASAMMLQAQPNIMPIEAMRHKQEQMVAMGAKLIQPSVVQRTATEAGIEKSAENSIVSNVAKNVSLAIENALKRCAWYLGLESEKVEYTIQTDFDIMTMTSEDRRQLVQEFLTGLVTFNEARSAYRKAGIATGSDEEAKKEYDKMKEELKKMEESKQETKTTNVEGKENVN